MAVAVGSWMGSLVVYCGGGLDRWRSFVVCSSLLLSDFDFGGFKCQSIHH